MAGFTEKTPYPQPFGDPDTQQRLNGSQEEIEFLPGTSMRIWYTHMGTSYPEHWHHAMEIIAGVNEHYICQAQGVTYTVKPNEILILPGGTLHTLSPAQDCNGFVYFISLEFIEHIRSAAGRLHALNTPVYITEKNAPALHMSVSALLGKMREVYFSDNDLRELLVDAYTLMLVERLLNCRIDKARGSHAREDKRHEYSELFAQVTDYINLHYAEELTIDGTASRFGLSRCYFSRLFKQYALCSFNEYLSLRRLKAAELLLSQPELSITEIAYRCGFGSSSSFSRVFHERRGCSPSEYRLIFVRSHSSALRQSGSETDAGSGE